MGMEGISKFVKRFGWIFKELHCLNKLALVGASSLLSDAIQLKTGTIFISRTSENEISEQDSALFLGQSIIGITAYVIIQGISIGMSALCSQAYGAKNHKLVGIYFMRALLIASLTCFPLWGIWMSAKPIVFHFTGDSVLAEGTGDYTSIFCFGYPAFVFNKLANGFLQSQNIIYFILSIIVIGNVINVFLQYLLIVVIPLGIKGLSLSYIVNLNIVSLLTFAYIRFTAVHLENFSGWSFHFLSGWLHFLWYALSCSGQLFLDVVVARVVPIVVIGFIIRDNDQFALIGILDIVWFTCTCVAIGYGNGTAIRIGNLLGRGELQKGKNTAVISLVFMLFLECCFCVLIFLLASPASYLLTSVEEMREKIELGMRILSITIIADMYTTVRGIFTGCCLQFYATLVQFVFMVVFSPLAAFIVFYIPWRAAGYYLILSIGSMISALIEIVILYCCNWNNIHELVLRNTEMKNKLTIIELPIQSRREKTFLLLRYIMLLFIGIWIFVFAYFCL
ncbi:Multidrug and toxin extrusion protein 1-like [Oopsacas minuta]|uniref:Multidrug and toxin extrusion protein n=1 Tax=Oopsacas minuta TaxID=111878 RepID=A0AAV7JFC7_9METZ|nr:Multidrug and toxin extrusion protein 1-like [Oopsacas minuta]